MNRVITKMLTVHSEDRDIGKWPNANHFEVDLPVDYKNVMTLRLSDVEIPGNVPVFCTSHQNRKMALRLGLGMSSQRILVEISEGSYTPQQMALELQGRFNEAIAAVLGLPYAGFEVVVEEVSLKFLFINSIEPFSLDFMQSEYSTQYYDNYTQWGLGSYLGFRKGIYFSDLGNVSLHWKSQTFTAVHSLVAPQTYDIQGDTQMYMELALYNSMDEIMPFTERSNNAYGAKYGGKHNSAFAKIPILNGLGKPTFVNRQAYVTNVFSSEPPLERIQKLKFKMRYHDGRLVDFSDTEFNFTIEIQMSAPFS